MGRQHDRFSRLLAEGLVIVVSILLAFALDAWWDTSRERQEALESLLVLDAEFEQIESELRRTLERNELVLAAADSILADLRSGAGSIAVGHLGDLLRLPTMAAPEGALQALISSGRLDLIRDPELQALLAGWSPVLQEVRDEEAIAERYVYEVLIPYLNEGDGASTALRVRMGGDTAGSVRVPDIDRMINLVETRRYLSENVLYERNRVGIEELLSQIQVKLREAIR